VAISEDQLETWSHQGSIAQSRATYNALKSVLEAQNTPYANMNYQVFLQGSYGNDTNVWDESDVDVVIVLNDCWQSDLSALSPIEKSAHEQHFGTATYGHLAFKRDVSLVLANKYGNDAKAGAKAISIVANGNRRKADVIVAVLYRKYFTFKNSLDQSYAEGICFWNSAGQMIANFPKQHSANLTAQHQATRSRLKPLIRVFKNVRTRLVEQGYINKGVAPSYYLEGLLYNVPVERFAGSYQDRVGSALDWIQTQASVLDLVCANGWQYLVRDQALTSWPNADFRAFVEGAVRLWNGRRPWVRLI
jgi:hypothetical protein